MNKYYELKPISDPPKEDGWYSLYVNNCNALFIVRWWDSEGRWQDVPPAYNMYLSPVPAIGAVWRELKEGSMPPRGEQVFLDGGENPPAWGRLEYDGSGPYIILIDSSGEEDWCDINYYDRWLDESGADRIAELEKEVEKYRTLLKQSYQAGIDAGEGYYGEDNRLRHSAYDEQWEDFKQKHNL